jgi:hypothetical protein
VLPTLAPSLLMALPVEFKILDVLPTLAPSLLMGFARRIQNS